MARRRFLFGTIAFTLLCATAAACGRLGSLADTTCALRFEVTPDSLTVAPGTSAILHARRTSTCLEAVTWTAGDTTIAVVASMGDSALVLGVRAGRTVVFGQPVYEWDVWKRTPVTVQ